MDATDAQAAPAPSVPTERAPTTVPPASCALRGIYNFACDSCKNNGKLRGWIYMLTALFTVLSSDLVVLCGWLWVNRAKLEAYKITSIGVLIVTCFVLKSLVFAAIGAMNTMRAYLDQHLSRNTPDAPQ